MAAETGTEGTRSFWKWCRCVFRARHRIGLVLAWAGRRAEREAHGRCAGLHRPERPGSGVGGWPRRVAERR